jgi:hypothetical protein
MALDRRDFLLALPALLGAAACSPAETAARGGRYIEIASSKVMSRRGTIVVFMPETKQTKDVWTGLSDELHGDFGLVAVKVEGPNSSEIIARAMQRHAPLGVVLMNNPTVLAYREYQDKTRHGTFPPAVIVMTSFLDGRPGQVTCATGISYEVPLITVVTNLRKLICTPIEQVGVVRRDPLAGFVARQAALGKREQIRVVEATVSADPNPSELKHALRRLKQHCDVIWILNDDRLLSQGLIANGWLPGLNERPWVPSIVGAASLVSPAQSFGTFAVLPDHTALGVQAANLVFDMAANDWSLPSGSPIELPLSTTTIMDLVQVHERFELRAGALSQVDRILE